MKVLREGNDRVTVQTGLLDLRTGRWTGLEVTQPARGWGRARPLQWSPDGRELYYQWYGYKANGDDTATKVYRTSASGSGRVDVTPPLGSWQTALALQPRYLARA
ncbi:MAG: hypothetical protein WCD35_08635 [Mycobacteriales bacterium]